MTHGIRLSSQGGAVYFPITPSERRATSLRVSSWCLEKLGRGL